MKRFEKFADRQSKSLVNHLNKYGKSGDLEILHQIRVDIKKIKAVLAVMNGCVKGFKAHRNFIPFRNIFRKAGEIREPEVLANLLQQYPVEGIIHEVKSTNAEQLVAAFNFDIPDFINVVNDHINKLKAFSRRVHRDNLKLYLSRKKKEVKSQLYPRPKMNSLHQVRKSIKEIVYLSEVGDGLKKKEAKFYDNMQDVIGHLHDKQVLLDFLKKNSKTANRSQHELIKSECTSNKDEIIRLANDYYGGRS